MLNQAELIRSYLLLRSAKGLPSLEDLQEEIAYEFKNLELLAEATTHSSAAQEFNLQQQEDVKLIWNERLEFLGDSVLGLVITEELMRLGKNFSEGELSKIRAALVSEELLVNVAEDLKLAEFLALGKSEQLQNNRVRPSILADGLEAVAGAVFLDGGYTAAKRVVGFWFSKLLKGNLRYYLETDFKSLLQEMTQQHYHLSPTYNLIASRGPAHDRDFEIAVSVQQRLLASGRGRTKKHASQVAAKRAYSLLKEELAHD